MTSFRSRKLREDVLLKRLLSIPYYIPPKSLHCTSHLSIQIVSTKKASYTYDSRTTLLANKRVLPVF
jgi:hypothetical protein